jgi:hypothetical protein
MENNSRKEGRQMTLQVRIFLESRPAVSLVPNAGHLYLVKRYVDVQPDGSYVNVYRPGPDSDPLADQIIQGTVSFTTLGPLLVNAGTSLSNSSSGTGYTTPFDMNSVDITQSVLASGGFASVDAAWSSMGGYAAGIGAVGYDYETPDGFDNHMSNSGATILSVLNSINLDIRTLRAPNGADLYLTSFYSYQFPGASDAYEPTLLGQGSIQTIVASASQQSGLRILGRDTVDDILIGTKFVDRYYGEQEASYSATNDTVSFARLPSDLGLATGLQDIKIKQEDLSSVPGVTEPVGVYGVNQDATKADLLYGIENVLLTAKSDRVIIENPETVFQSKILIDGGEDSSPSTADPTSADVLDFSAALGQVVIRNARDGSQAIELYSPSNDATNLRFQNFEYIKATAFDDILNLKKMAAGGPLSTVVPPPVNGVVQLSDQQKSDAAWAAFHTALAPPSVPRTVYDAAYNTLVAALSTLKPYQQHLQIDGGAGGDIIIGADVGVSDIYGGDGDDYLFSGQYGSNIYGGIGKDRLISDGVDSHLTGGAGNDLFILSNRATVTDASKQGDQDYAAWGGLVLTGGVNQWWMEGGFAYFSPATSLISGALGAFGGVFMAAAAIVDGIFMGTFRYGTSSAGELVIQAGRGRAGQAVITDYKVDFDKVEASAHVTVLKQAVTGSDKNLAELKNYIKNALAAGSGKTAFNSDPLVLDLDGNGLDLTRQTRGVYFDIDGDGFAEKTAWVYPTDAFLVRDLNANGKIDNITEMFGNATTSGFLHLKTFDSNNDNKINSLDTGFGTLQVWRDLNGNGVTDAGELQSLTASNIKEISLTSTALRLAA